MRPKGSPQVLESRRKIAARMFEQGNTLAETAASVGCSISSASRWRDAWQNGVGLSPKRHPGRSPKLAAQQCDRLMEALMQGTRYWGYAPDGWTGPLVQDMIERLFGVSYHPNYIPHLLRQLGWSPQQPKRRARERQEDAIAQWIREDWPRLKKEPRTQC